MNIKIIGKTSHCVWCGIHLEGTKKLGCGSIEKEKGIEIVAQFCSDTCLSYMSKLHYKLIGKTIPWRKWEEKRDGIILFEESIEI